MGVSTLRTRKNRSVVIEMIIKTNFITKILFSYELLPSHQTAISPVELRPRLVTPRADLFFI